jgi:hypothetical protein
MLKLTYWNWDMDSFKALQLYCLQHDNNFIGIMENFPSVNSYNKNDLMGCMKTWLFYINNGAEWLTIPNIKPWDTSRKNFDFGVLIVWDVFVKSDGVRYSIGEGSWNTLNLPKPLWR